MTSETTTAGTLVRGRVTIYRVILVVIVNVVSNRNEWTTLRPLVSRCCLTALSCPLNWCTSLPYPDVGGMGDSFLTLLVTCYVLLTRPLKDTRLEVCIPLGMGPPRTSLPHVTLVSNLMVRCPALFPCGRAKPLRPMGLSTLTLLKRGYRLLGLTQVRNLVLAR